MCRSLYDFAGVALPTTTGTQHVGAISLVMTWKSSLLSLDKVSKIVSVSSCLKTIKPVISLFHHQYN